MKDCKGWTMLWIIFAVGFIVQNLNFTSTTLSNTHNTISVTCPSPVWLSQKPASPQCVLLQSTNPITVSRRIQLCTLTYPTARLLVWCSENPCKHCSCVCQVLDAAAQCAKIHKTTYRHVSHMSSYGLHFIIDDVKLHWKAMLRVEPNWSKFVSTRFWTLFKPGESQVAIIDHNVSKHANPIKACFSYQYNEPLSL